MHRQTTHRSTSGPGASLLLPALFCALATAVIAVPEVALADRQAAKEAFRQGRDHFKHKRYDLAAQALRKAYKLEPHPVLLRYLGQTYYKLNKPRASVTAFRKYLRDAPNARDRKQVLAQVRRMEMVIGAEAEDAELAASPTPVAPVVPSASSTTAAPVPPPTRVDRAKKVDLAPTGEDQEVPEDLAEAGGRSRSGAMATTEPGSTTPLLTTLKWVVTGVGLGGLAAGGVFAALAAGKASEIEDAVVRDNPGKDKPTVAFSREHYNVLQANKQHRTAMIVSFIAGGVATAAGIALFVWDAKGSDEKRLAQSSGQHPPGTVRISPVLGPGSYGVTGGFSF